jgi:hypothetical protein
MLLIRPHSWLFGEGSFEVKLPTIWTDEKQSRAKAERREKLEEKNQKRKSQRRESVSRKKIKVREEVEKSRASEARKVGSLKRRDARSKIARRGGAKQI